MLKDYTPNFRKLEELLEALQIKWKLSDKEVDDLREILPVVELVVHGILDAAVEVDGQHALGTCGDATGTEGVAETVVLDLIAQAAA